MTAQSKKPRDVPPLDDDGVDYDNWKIRVRKWCKISKEERRFRALSIQVALGPKAFQACKHLEEEKLESDEGVELLIETLDKYFIPDKLRHRIGMFRKHMEMKRSSESVLEFVDKYMEAYHNYRSLIGEIPYDDSTLALMLLTSANLGDDEKLISAQMKEPPMSEDVISILKRVFSTSNYDKRDIQGQTSESDTFLAKTSDMEKDDRKNESTNETLYTKWNGRGSYRYRQANRGRYEKRNGGPGRNYNRRNRGTNFPRINTRDLNGKIRKCLVCNSIWHFMQDCPDKDKYIKEPKDNKHSNQEVNLSFLSFVGCASNDDKLKTLLNDSQGYALLDSGCSNTVAGEEWVSKYIANLSVGDRLKVEVEASNESFTFGDGKTISALRRITFPCWVGGKSANITTDVVDCKIPLLLSRKSMTKVGMIINFGKHIAIINNRRIKLKVTDSGHYALPISL